MTSQVEVESNALTQFLSSQCELKSISCKSIVVTVFGDMVSQHGNWIWLGSLIQALKPLGFSERLIRTSVFRLVQDDWLRVEKIGRKSFYTLTDSASQQYTKAARRIYAESAQHSDGSWLMVMPSFVPEEQMQSFKRQLRWLGFSPLASGVLAHPSLEKTSLAETLQEMDLLDKVIVLESQPSNQQSEDVLKHLVHEKWTLELLADSYRTFINTYQTYIDFDSVNESIKKEFSSHIELPCKLISRCSLQKKNLEQAFCLRTLLVHEYRRILLRDHELAEKMLPENWPGKAAHFVVSSLYQQLAKSSSQFVMEYFENQDGYLPRPSESFYQRFKAR